MLRILPISLFIHRQVGFGDQNGSSLASKSVQNCCWGFTNGANRVQNAENGSKGTLGALKGAKVGQGPTKGSKEPKTVSRVAPGWSKESPKKTQEANNGAKMEAQEVK